MTPKVDPKAKERLQMQDLTILRGVLADVDRQVIAALKGNRDDVRFVQGYSAAIDFLQNLIKHP